jgi:hypothetical protein
VPANSATLVYYSAFSNGFLRLSATGLRANACRILCKKVLGWTPGLVHKASSGHPEVASLEVPGAGESHRNLKMNLAADLLQIAHSGIFEALVDCDGQAAEDTSSATGVGCYPILGYPL